MAAKIDRRHEGAAMEASLAAITRRRIFSGARSIASRHWQRQPNWVVAMTVFGVGSTYACALCREMGLDPDALEASPWPDTPPRPNSDGVGEAGETEGAEHG